MIVSTTFSFLQLHGDSAVRVRPEWSIVLSYEYKLREVMKLESFFTTPLALRAAQSVESPNKFHKGAFKGDYKGGGKDWKGKGKGKSKSKTNLPKEVAQKLQGFQLAWRTPDGRDHCFAWNTGSCKGSCGRAHQCRVKGYMVITERWIIVTR